MQSSATPSAASAPADFNQEEKQLLAEGYRAEMHRGERVFCRREVALGSHLPGPKICGTATQLKATELEGKDAAQHVQTWAPMPPGGK